MLKELIEYLTGFRRPEKLTVQIQGRYSKDKTEDLIYNDSKKVYEQRLHLNQKSYIVHSRKAFVDYIKEELCRRNSDGTYSTVQIGIDNAEFTANDDINEGKCTFERLYSEQFKTLKNYKNRDLTHNEFLAMIKALKPSFQSELFQMFYQQVSKLRLYKTAKLNSNPYFDDNGEMESGYVCEYKITSGINEGEVESLILPPYFEVTMPFVKAGEDLYTFEVELLYSRDDYNNIIITPIIPDFEHVVEQAILDEADFIKSELAQSGKNNILVLADI